MQGDSRLVVRVCTHRLFTLCRWFYYWIPVAKGGDEVPASRGVDPLFVRAAEHFCGAHLSSSVDHQFDRRVRCAKVLDFGRRRAAKQDGFWLDNRRFELRSIGRTPTRIENIWADGLPTARSVIDMNVMFVVRPHRCAIDATKNSPLANVGDCHPNTIEILRGPHVLKSMPGFSVATAV